MGPGLQRMSITVMKDTATVTALVVMAAGEELMKMTAMMALTTMVT